MSAILGIDVAQATFAVALWREGRALERAEFDNTQTGFKKLQRFLKKRDVVPVHACLEATGRYWEHLAEFLVERGHSLSVVNPARIKKYAESQLRRNKTDRLDAEVIADFYRTQHCGLRHRRLSANCKPWCVIWRTWKPTANDNAIVSTHSNTPRIPPRL